MHLREAFFLALAVIVAACGSEHGAAPRAVNPPSPAMSGAEPTVPNPGSLAPSSSTESAAANVTAANDKTPAPAGAMPEPNAAAGAGGPSLGKPDVNAGAMAATMGIQPDAIPVPTGPPGIAIDPASGELVFRTERISIEPGEESYTCFGATLQQDVVVDGFAKSSQPFVHHAQFVEALIPEPEGISTCKQQFKLTWLPIFLAGNGASELRFDEGVGHVIGAGTQLVLQMHLFNSSDKKQTQAVEIRMHRSSSANPTPVSPWAIGSAQIHIPERQAGSARNVCTLNGAAEVLAVFPHMHQLGKRLTVEVGKSMDAMKPLYARDPFNFDDQRMEKVNLKLEEGDVLRVTCDYNTNTGDGEVTFGESSNDEMCFFVGFAKEGSGFADCPNLWDAVFAL